MHSYSNTGFVLNQMQPSKLASDVLPYGGGERGGQTLFGLLAWF